MKKNKPKWKDIPDWVKYISMDDDGSWFGYEGKPEYIDIFGGWDYRWEGKYIRLSNRSNKGIGKDTLEERPVKENRDD